MDLVFSESHIRFSSAKSVNKGFKGLFLLKEKVTKYFYQNFCVQHAPLLQCAFSEKKLDVSF